MLNIQLIAQKDKKVDSIKLIVFDV